jgi:NADH:ubiquinone oxidoreductase subunit 6 (subunit J)
LDFKTILFYALAVIVLAPAVMVMVAKDIIRVAFWLLASLSGVAGMYILLDADFLGATQVLVYIGGILVLILFGIMMTHRDPIMIEVEDVRRRSPAVGLAVGLVMFGALLGLVLGTGWDTGTGRDTGAVTTPDIGRALLTDYILPFEIISVLLLVVLCGSAYIARRGKEAPHA